MSKKEDTTIRFSTLKPGKYTYHYALTDEFFDEWKNDEIQGGEVEIDVMMERMERMLMFDFRLAGKVTTQCDRCLGEIEVSIEGEEHLSARFSDTETTDDEEVVVLSESAVEIDLAQWLYEYVAVRIPLQHIHPEGECDPAVTRYITDEDEEKENTEIDPRWEALRNLK